MNTAKADQLIVTSLGATATLAVVERVQTGNVPNVVRVLIGAFVAAAMLTFAAQFVPDLAGMLAVLVLVAFVAHSGPSLWGAITTATRSGTPKKTATTEGAGGGARHLVTLSA